MRIYYVMEAQGLRCHVLSALGVDARAWNRLHRRVLRWRQELEHYYGIPAAAELRPRDLGCRTSLQAISVCHCRCRRHPASRLGARNGGGWPRDCTWSRTLPWRTAASRWSTSAWTWTAYADAFRRISLDRLFNRVNATADHDGGYALLIFGQEPDETVVRTYERLRSYNPVPVRVGACGDGWHTRNLPIERVIGSPAFRSPETDSLLQVAGLVAHALLWREEHVAGVVSPTPSPFWTAP